MTRYTFGRVVGILVLTTTVTAQAQSASSERTRQAATSPPRVSAPRAPQTELLFTRPDQRVVRPSEPGLPRPATTRRRDATSAPSEPEPLREGQLLPEGYRLVSRRGVLGRQGRWLTFTTLPLPDRPAVHVLRLLPGRWLADIESILRRDSGTRDFEISGMVTEYRGLNYLLMTHALAVEPVAGNPQDGNPQVTSRPDGADGRLPSANEILGAISREVPARALPTPTGSGETSIGGTAPSPADGRSPPDGSILVDRVGRLVRGPKGWMLTLDSGGGPSVEPSIRLLPSRLLETMETASAGGIEHTTFVVGGEVHAFGKESFLILHKVLVRRSLGNLR